MTQWGRMHENENIYISEPLFHHIALLIPGVLGKSPCRYTEALSKSGFLLFSFQTLAEMIRSTINNALVTYFLISYILIFPLIYVTTSEINSNHGFDFVLFRDMITKMYIKDYRSANTVNCYKVTI